MKTVYCGLDLASRSCHVVAMDEQGKLIHSEKFTTSEENLIDVFRTIPGNLHVHMEATELAAWARGILKRSVPRIARVMVSHPKKNAWIAKDPRKSDKVDAFKLADLARMGRVHEVYYSDDDDRFMFKKIVQHYDDLTREEVRLKHTIKARLRAMGIIRRGTRIYSPTHRIQVLNQIQSGEAHEILKHLYRLLDETLEVRKRSLHLMKKQAREFPEIRSFREVPGIDWILACRFSAYIQTPHRFHKRERLWRYCQLGVTDRTSDGKPLGRRRLDKNGNGRLKDLSRKAFEGARRTKEDNAFKRTYRRTLQRTHDATHARLTVQRKILTTLWTMWKGGSPYDDNRG